MTYGVCRENSHVSVFVSFFTLKRRLDSAIILYHKIRPTKIQRLLRL